MKDQGKAVEGDGKAVEGEGKAVEGGGKAVSHIQVSHEPSDIFGSQDFSRSQLGGRPLW